MDLNEVSVFVKVVQAGSFSLAAKRLGMPNSTVSAKVSSLEARLGVTLIQRTTRRLNITPAGEAYFQRCLRGLEEILGAETEATTVQSEPQGTLRVTAPVDLGSNILPQIVSTFTRRYPKVKLEFILTDRSVDLLAEEVDLAIRAGELKDSSLVVKKLGMISFSLFASARYLKTAGTPTHPRDLAKHRCLQFTPLGTDTWKLTGPKGSASISLKGELIVNDLNTIKSLVLADEGVALLPTYLCRPEVEACRLLHILPDWRTNTLPVHFVYPAQKFLMPKVSAFIEQMTGLLREGLVGTSG